MFQFGQKNLQARCAGVEPRRPLGSGGFCCHPGRRWPACTARGGPGRSHWEDAQKDAVSCSGRCVKDVDNFWPFQVYDSWFMKILTPYCFLYRYVYKLKLETIPPWYHLFRPSNELLAPRPTRPRRSLCITSKWSRCLDPFQRLTQKKSFEVWHFDSKNFPKFG